MQTEKGQLEAHFGPLLAYARRKTGESELAHDLVQGAMLKALEHEAKLREPDRLLPWLYRVVKNAISDVYRQRHRVVEVTFDETAQTGPEYEPALVEAVCQCVIGLATGLKPEYAKVIIALELEEQSPTTLAEELGVAPGNLRVRRHRARKALRKELELACGGCATHGCRDCDCDREN